MEKKKTKPIDLNNQVHSEFETSVGNSFNIVREETLRRNQQMDDDEGPLNELTDEDSVKNDWNPGGDLPTMNAPAAKKD